MDQADPARSAVSPPLPVNAEIKPFRANLAGLRRGLFVAVLAAGVILSTLAASYALDIAPLLPPTPDTDAPAPALPQPVPTEPKKEKRDPDTVLLPRIVGLRFEFFIPPAKTEPAKAGEPAPKRQTRPTAPPETFTGLDNRVPQLDAALSDPGSPLAKATADLLALPLTWRRLDAVTEAATQVLRQSGWSLARVFAPEQELSGKTLRLEVMPVPLEEVIVEGARWTKPERLRRHFRKDIGIPVNLPRLTRPLAFINQHPFRRIVPALTPGKTTGTSRIVLKAEETRPWRLFAGYEITNSRTTGHGRYSAGFVAAAPWRTEDIITAQYATDSTLSHLTSASVNYLSPLPWGHYFTFTGLWADSVTIPHPDFRQHTRDYMAGFAYTIPLRPFSGWTHEVIFGLEWRRSELEKHFAGVEYFANAFDLTPLSLAYRLRRADKHGATSLLAEAVLSPGAWIGWRSDATSYQTARYATGSKWSLLRWDFRRDWILPAGFTAVNRFWGQWTEDRLPDPARIYLGGGRSIRGYRDSELAGDSGVAVSVEVQSPRLPLKRCGPDRKKQPHPLSVRLAGFWDWGQIRNRTPLDVGECAAKTMAGAGLGIRVNYGERFSFRLDYGWRLRYTGAGEDDRNGYWHGALQCTF